MIPVNAVLAVHVLCAWRFVSGMVTPIPIPKTLIDCLDQKTDNSSSFPPRFIQSFCISKFVETTAIWSPNMTDPNVKNYITSLLRGVVREAEVSQTGSRQKRQAFGAPVRREVRAAPYQFNFRNFAMAVRRLKTQFSVRPGVNNYDVIAGIHAGRPLDSAHNGPNFLGWHRIYLLIMEQALGTTIPYWDSSLDFEMADPSSTILFTPRYFGNGFGFVTTGPFANLPGVPIIRNIGSDGTLISKQAIQSVLSRTTHAEIVEPSNAATVQFSIEAHHNGPHVWVDGTLASLNSAAYDPIFFCHHAFVDYIWELFRSRIPNAEADYPPTAIAGHEPFMIMDFGDFPFAPRIRNADGYSNRYARLRMYEPAPACPACAGSPDLVCDPARGLCISRAAPPQFRQAAAARVQGGAAGFGGAMVVPAADAVEPDTPARAQNAVAQTGPLATGPRFVSPFRDARTRGGTLPVAPADPALTRGRRSVAADENSNLNENHMSWDQVVPYQNTFVINGQSDVNLWAFIPVKIVNIATSGVNYTQDEEIQLSNHGESRSLPEFAKMSNSVVYRRCSHLKNGPDRVFVESDGISYSGRYKDFALMDPSIAVSSSFTYVGVRKPTMEVPESKAMISAYDTCGRVCRAKCLIPNSIPPLYKSCAGSILADNRLPFMYRKSYDEALRGLWGLLENSLLGLQDQTTIIPLMFVCDHDTSWPWYKAKM